MSYKEFTEFFVELINLKDIKDFSKIDCDKYLKLFDGFEYQCIKWTIEKYKQLRKYYHKIDYYAYFMWYVYHFCSNNIVYSAELINNMKCKDYNYNNRCRLMNRFDIQISDYLYDSDNKHKIIEDNIGDDDNVIKFASVIDILIRKTLENNGEFKCKFKTPINIEKPVSADLVSTDKYVVIFESMEKAINQYHIKITELMKEFKSEVDQLISNEYSIIFESMEKIINQYHIHVIGFMEECKSNIKELSKK